MVKSAVEREVCRRIMGGRCARVIPGKEKGTLSKKTLFLFYKYKYDFYFI